MRFGSWLTDVVVLGRGVAPTFINLLKQCGDSLCCCVHWSVTMLKTIVATLMLVGMIAGCNTIKGTGKDIERGGEKLQNAADKHQ